ncbi:MAG: RecX family transcriptional regulator [Deltaproteobacteria bacterium]|nr:RecX family transcriptional regulator [Deltaproteobacteria bacterium]
MQSALRLLSFRQRTIHELTEKLLSKGYSEDEINGTVERLIEGRYLDDEAFAGDFACSRMKNRQWGRIKVSHELRKRGVAAGVIEKTLNGLKEETEIDAAKEALRKWLKKSGRKDWTKDTAARAARHLSGKGFPFSTIRSAMNNPGITDGGEE